MKLDTGMIIVVIALVLFYLRIMQLRGRKRRLDKEKILAHMREANRKKGKIDPLPGRDRNAPPFMVRSWILVVIGIVLMLVGVAARSTLVLPDLLETYWWAPTTAGILVFLFCFKVE